jgi:hypothetical protein
MQHHVQRSQNSYLDACRYEVLEYEPNKRLVLSGLSEYHTQLDQFAFMPDRHDSKHTCVRYISNLKLREWRSALQPVIGSESPPPSSASAPAPPWLCLDQHGAQQEA